MNSHTVTQRQTHVEMITLHTEDTHTTHCRLTRHRAPGTHRTARHTRVGTSHSARVCSASPTSLEWTPEWTSEWTSEWTRRREMPRGAEEAPAARERPVRTRRTPTKLLQPREELTRSRTSEPPRKQPPLSARGLAAARKSTSKAGDEEGAAEAGAGAREVRAGAADADKEDPVERVRRKHTGMEKCI